MKNLTPATREEKIMAAIANHETVELTPATDAEGLLCALANGTIDNFNPKTRLDYFLYEIVQAENAKVDLGVVDPLVEVGPTK